MELIQPRGFSWDSYSLGKHDLDFIANYIVRNNIKKLLEIGSGMSSLLISQLCQVDTLENDKKWAYKVNEGKRDYHDLNVILWDGKLFPVKGRWDVVFIDGPEELDENKRGSLGYYGLSREVSFKAVTDFTDVVFVHDACRHPELAYQVSYLAKDYRVTDIIKSDDNKIQRYLVAWKRINT